MDMSGMNVNTALAQQRGGSVIIAPHSSGGLSLSSGQTKSPLSGGDTRKTQSMYGVAPVVPGSLSSQTASHMGTIRSPLSGGGSGIVAPSSSGGAKVRRGGHQHFPDWSLAKQLIVVPPPLPPSSQVPEQDLSGALFVKENKDLGIR
jgi:hypothetical protein